MYLRHLRRVADAENILSTVIKVLGSTPVIASRSNSGTLPPCRAALRTVDSHGTLGSTQLRLVIRRFAPEFTIAVLPGKLVSAGQLQVRRFEP